MTSLANKPPSQHVKPERMRSDVRRNLMGYMTMAMCQGVEIALFHSTLLGLEIAFNTVTGGRIPFRVEYISRVKVTNDKEAVRA